ncbi:MAG: hypothetical protein HZA90_21010 [Verrucomicrobia bacterium]|nr:hypothetical protein [Verrucomicrobiota bacterium]
MKRACPLPPLVAALPQGHSGKTARRLVAGHGFRVPGQAIMQMQPGETVAGAKQYIRVER